jgi:hypothetical protein
MIDTDCPRCVRSIDLQRRHNPKRQRTRQPNRRAVLKRLKENRQWLLLVFALFIERDREQIGRHARCCYFPGWCCARKRAGQSFDCNKFAQPLPDLAVVRAQ